MHTVTFLHGFVLFHNPKGIPIYFQTIENDAKTLPCAHSLRNELKVEGLNIRALKMRPMREAQGVLPQEILKTRTPKCHFQRFKHLT